MNKYKKIREMIRRPCNIVYPVPFMVQYYPGTMVGDSIKRMKA